MNLTLSSQWVSVRALPEAKTMISGSYKESSIWLKSRSKASSANWTRQRPVIFPDTLSDSGSRAGLSRVKGQESVKKNEELKNNQIKEYQKIIDAIIERVSVWLRPKPLGETMRTVWSLWRTQLETWPLRSCHDCHVSCLADGCSLPTPMLLAASAAKLKLHHQQQPTKTNETLRHWELRTEN